jgi:hypothetical protein
VPPLNHALELAQPALGHCRPADQEAEREALREQRRRGKVVCLVVSKVEAG